MEKINITTFLIIALACVAISGYLAWRQDNKRMKKKINNEHRKNFPANPTLVEDHEKFYYDN